MGHATTSPTCPDPASKSSPASKICNSPSSVSASSSPGRRFLSSEPSAPHRTRTSCELLSAPRTWLFPHKDEDQLQAPFALQDITFFSSRPLHSCLLLPPYWSTYDAGGSMMQLVGNAVILSELSMQNSSSPKRLNRSR